jgi:hypothetical protein
VGPIAGATREGPAPGGADDRIRQALITGAAGLVGAIRERAGRVHRAPRRARVSLRRLDSGCEILAVPGPRPASRCFPCLVPAPPLRVVLHGDASIHGAHNRKGTTSTLATTCRAAAPLRRTGARRPVRPSASP